MAVVFKVKEDGKSRSLIEYTVTDADIEEFRRRYSGLDVVAELKLAVDKIEDRIVRRPTKRGMVRFLADWMRRAAADGKAAGAITRARDELSRPEWQRRGFKSQEDYDREQHRIWLEKQQGDLALYEPRDRDEAAVLASLAALRQQLAVQAIELPSEGYRRFPNAIYSCYHSFESPLHMTCQGCGAFRHQIIASERFAEEWAR